MKIVILDITSRNNPQYNPSLCKALVNIMEGGKVVLLSPRLSKQPDGFEHKKLLKIVPLKWGAGKGVVKRFLRAVEVLVNYLYVLFYVTLTRPNILHIQWLPLVEFFRGEEVFLFLLKKLTPHLKIIYTAHNIYPHNLDSKGKIAYHNRFVRFDKYIDGYITHLFSARRELSEEFGVPQQKIFVAFHGIYIAENYHSTRKSSNNNVKRIILYGIITPYKGPDILLDAIRLLPQSQRECLHITIAGATSEDYLKELQSKAEGYKVDFFPYIVPDDELHSLIAQSDYIALPYRNISQSGVLLLALYFRKPLLVADLPSFKETLQGFTDDMFFENGNPQALTDLIVRHLSHEIDVETQVKAIEHLNTIYSWEEAARMTYTAYKNSLG